jgi:hypothetical protein
VLERIILESWNLAVTQSAVLSTRRPAFSLPCGDAISRAVGELVSWAVQGRTHTGQGRGGREQDRARRGEAKCAQVELEKQE